MTEVEAYHILKEVWGKYVPRLVSYGTTGGGSIVYIATEEIMGHEIGMGMLLTLPFVCCFLVMLAYCLWCVAQEGICLLFL